jgi:hypothetical protein
LKANQKVSDYEVSFIVRYGVHRRLKRSSCCHKIEARGGLDAYNNPQGSASGRCLQNSPRKVINKEFWLVLGSQPLVISFKRRILKEMQGFLETENKNLLYSGA